MEASASPDAPRQDPPTAFGARLVALRKLPRLTQIDLATAIASTPRPISYYEAEGGNPDLPIVVQLATALNVTTDELLGVAQLPTPKATPAANPDERRYWRRFQQRIHLPKKHQRAVLRMLDSLTKARTAN